MKKIISVLLSLVLCVGLTSCGFLGIGDSLREAREGFQEAKEGLEEAKEGLDAIKEEVNKALETKDGALNSLEEGFVNIVGELQEHLIIDDKEKAKMEAKIADMKEKAKTDDERKAAEEMEKNYHKFLELMESIKGSLDSNGTTATAADGSQETKSGEMSDFEKAAKEEAEKARGELEKLLEEIQKGLKD